MKSENYTISVSLLSFPLTEYRSFFIVYKVYNTFSTEFPTLGFLHS